MQARLGNALILIGLIVLVVFLITFDAGAADLRTLLVGAGLSIVGLIFRRRGQPRREESARFVTMRRVLRRRPEEPPEEEG
jgi:hypothetical protein